MLSGSNSTTDSNVSLQYQCPTFCWNKQNACPKIKQAVKSLTSLFNASLESGMIPSEWKAANITPVPKGADRELVKNYRPISVLPIVAKVFEAIVHTQLYSYLESGFLLHPAQSGFQPHHCTEDVLIKTIDDWRIALDQDEIVGTVLIDLRAKHLTQ